MREEKLRNFKLWKGKMRICYPSKQKQYKSRNHKAKIKSPMKKISSKVRVSQLSKLKQQIIHPN
jgi:hypothetical protein